jgi:hypothetical protein
MELKSRQRMRKLNFVGGMRGKYQQPFHPTALYMYRLSGCVATHPGSASQKAGQGAVTTKEVGEACFMQTTSIDWL